MSDYPYRIRRTYQGIKIDIKARSQKEAERKLMNKIREIDSNPITAEGNSTLDAFVDMYFEKFVEGKVSDITLQGRKGVYNARIRPYLGAMTLKTISAADCQDVINRLDGYARDSILKTSQLLFNFFKVAKRLHMIVENPAEDLALPVGDSHHGRACTLTEAALLHRAAETHPSGLWVLSMYYLGMRPHETSLFRSSHINYHEGLVFIDGTKTAAAVRIVPCPDFLLARFKSARFRKNSFVFPNSSGGQSTGNNRTRWWRAIKREMNLLAGCEVYRNEIVDPVIADDFVPYCLRHSFATNLKDAGVPFHIRQELLGHSSGTITDRYTHRTEDSLRQASDLLKTYYVEHRKKIEQTADLVLSGSHSALEVTESDDLVSRFFPDAR